ncbi:MAG: hypothetical protein IPN07_09535 [Dehalococcoidia bacterium]|nr:hypothetical protein [Dehalococcoidia bacterium]
MGPGSPLAPLLERWNQLPRSRQVLLGGIAAAALVAFYLIFVASKSPAMVVAFSSLAPEDSAAIADELESQGVPYTIGGGGSTVSVPANEVAEVRIRLAQAGLPKGGSVGLEIFDKTNFGATDFVQQVNFRRGWRGARPFDKHARRRQSQPRPHCHPGRGHLQPGPETRHCERPAPARSRHEAGREPGPRHHQPGHELRRRAGTERRHHHRRDRHRPVRWRDVRQPVLNRCDRLANGPATPVRSGAAERRPADPCQSSGRRPERRHRSSHPEFRPRHRCRRQVRRRKRGRPSQQHEHDGDLQRLQPQCRERPGDGHERGHRRHLQHHGERRQHIQPHRDHNEQRINKTTSTTVKAPGSIDRLSVSVVLDESVTAAQEASITSAVAAAVGLDQVRGDTLSVTRLPFDASVREDLLPAASDGIGTYLSYLKFLLPMLAVALGFILVMLLLRALGKRQLALPAGYQQAMLPAAGAIAALPRGESMPALQPASDPHEERVLKLADSNPRAVADVVQTWMREEE